MKNLSLLFILYSCFLYAQTGNVGINTASPSATLDIVSKDSTASTKALKVSNSSNTEMLTVLNNGQVGINQTSPAPSALLELKAADKSLLLTRVNNATDITTPVNGMIVYDITQKCVRGYENGSWSGCLSSSGGTPPTPEGDDFGFGFTSTVKQITSNNDSSGYASSGLITTDGKIFLFGNEPTLLNKATSTPAYSPLPNGELAQKIALGGRAAMALTTTGKVYIMGFDNVNTWPAFGGIAVANKWTELTIAGETSFVDIQTPPAGTNSFVRGSSGKVYRSGWGNSGAVPERVIPYTAMVFPPGVTSYTDMWVDSISVNNIFLKGNDNNIYAAGGSNQFGELGTGNTTQVNLNVAPVKVIFPPGVNNVVKISSSDRGISLALTADGKAYGWGRWRATNIYTFAATPVTGALSGNNLLLPSPIMLPNLNSDTKFTDVLAGDLLSVVKTDKMTYFKGYNSSCIIMNPITLNSTYYNSGYTGPNLDMQDGAKYNLAAPIWHLFKTISTTGGTSDGSFGNSTVFAISQSDKAYVWGRNVRGIAGTGGGFPSNFCMERPIRIATGIGDPQNPNPVY